MDNGQLRTEANRNEKMKRKRERERLRLIDRIERNKIKKRKKIKKKNYRINVVKF